MKASLIKLIEELSWLKEELDKKANDKDRYSYLLNLLADNAIFQSWRIRLFYELMEEEIAFDELIKATAENGQDIFNKSSQSYDYYDNDDSDDEAEDRSSVKESAPQSLVWIVLENTQPQYAKRRVQLAEAVFTQAISQPELIPGHQQILINQKQAIELAGISSKVAARVLHEKRFNHDLKLDDTVQLVTAHPDSPAMVNVFAKTWRHRVVSACQFFSERLGAWTAEKLDVPVRDYRTPLLQKDENDSVFVKLASHGGKLAEMVSSDSELSKRFSTASSAMTKNEFELDELTGQELFNLVFLPNETGILWCNHVTGNGKLCLKLVQAVDESKKDLWTDKVIDFIGVVFKKHPELWKPKSIYFNKPRASLVAIPELISAHPNLGIISEAVDLIRSPFDKLNEMEAALWRATKRLVKQEKKSFDVFEAAKEKLKQAQVTEQNSKQPGKPILSKPMVAPKISEPPRRESYAGDRALVLQDHQYAAGEWAGDDADDVGIQTQLVTARRQSKILDAKGKQGLGSHQNLTPGGTEWQLKKAGKDSEKLRELTKQVEGQVPAIGEWYADHHDSLTRKPTVLNPKGHKVGFAVDAKEEEPPHHTLHQ